MPRIRNISTNKTAGQLLRSDYFGGDPVAGATFKGQLGALQDFLVANTGAARIYVPLIFHGEFVLNQVFDGFTLPFNADAIGMEVIGQVVPMGANVTVDLVNLAGVSYARVATLAAGSRYQLTTYGTVLALNAGDFVAGKVTAIGSLTPGGYANCRLILAPRLS